MKLRALTDSLYASPALRVADAMRVLGVTFPTAQSYLKQLVQLGILTKMAGVAPASYVSRPILAVTYED